MPLILIISRIDRGQKGIELFLKEIKGKSVLEHILDLDAEFVIAGAGDKELCNELLSLQENLNKIYPGRTYMNFTYISDELADKMKAGADFFLMPSRYEPCGIEQLKNCKFGTVPIVRRTGGLADTITQFDMKTGLGNGFVFDVYCFDVFSFSNQ